jgi:hypothetical protein
MCSISVYCLKFFASVDEINVQTSTSKLESWKSNGNTTEHRKEGNAGSIIIYHHLVSVLLIYTKFQALFKGHIQCHFRHLIRLRAVQVDCDSVCES